jgi:hypothetical protein
MSRTNKRYDLDKAFLKIAASLARDFRDHLDPATTTAYHEAVHKRDIRWLRSLTDGIVLDDCLDPYTYKVRYQLKSLAKRYRFKHDLYTDDELAQDAIQKFLGVQDRLGALDLTCLDVTTRQVVNLTRGIIAKILGDYTDDEHRSLCRFGRKASVGVPARAACTAARWEWPISGSSEQISWFDSEMSQVEVIQNYWSRRFRNGPLLREQYHETDQLALVLVPKSYKSLRSIMPNTTIGTYLSYGLGEMIRKRLKRVGYDLCVLQEQHKRLARWGSMSVNGNVTADLSSASDSISSELLELLLPSEWFNILRTTRIGNVMLPDGTVVQSKTFCTMGIGYTFPLQTLVFLSLLKAINCLTTRDRRKRLHVSVYGDDLIYPRSIHETVLHVFSRLGFVVNEEKTFVDSHFRESCGGDYYRGVDVRPFQPQNDGNHASLHVYEATLYKWFNGLLRRWTPTEISHTLHEILTLFEQSHIGIKIIPAGYPDNGGIRVSSPQLNDLEILKSFKHVRPKCVGHGIFRFVYLRFISDQRKEDRHEPYLWERLREQPLVEPWVDTRGVPVRSSGLQRKIEELTGQDRAVVGELTWRKTEPGGLNSGRRLKTMKHPSPKRGLVATVGISGSGCYKRKTGFSRFENP